MKAIGRMILALMFVGAGCTPVPSRPARSVVATTTIAPTTELLDTLAIAATGELPGSATLDAVRREVSTGTFSVDSYAARLTSDRRFSERIAPSLLLKEYLVGRAQGGRLEFYLLEQTPEGVFHLRGGCKKSEAVIVPGVDDQTQVGA